jgi:AraC-like DNA-binding protein
MLQEYEREFAEFLYYTPRSLDKEGQIWPVRAGRNTAKPNYRVGPKRIECYSLHFVDEGNVCLEYDDRRLELQQGDLFCLFPGRTHHYYMLPSDSLLRMRWIALDGDKVKPLLEMAGLTPDVPFRTKIGSAQVSEPVDCLIRTMESAAGWKPAISFELHSLIYKLFAGLIPETAIDHAAEPDGWIRECVDYMNLHATEGITVQQVAAFAGVHRSYFSSVFTSQVGIPPAKYLQNIRMEKARRLLGESDATITEIALSLGYPNLYSFTRAFKSYYKISPLAVRKHTSPTASWTPKKV